MWLYNIYTALKAGKIKNMGKLQKWNGNIANHFWYCCRTCEGSVTTLKVCVKLLLLS